MKSIYVDWMKEFSKDNWEFVGRRALEDGRGEWADDNPDGINEDEGYPIYNFAYPLFRDQIDDQVILRVCEETNCTVVYSNERDKYYLALTGCGMDFTQDIALAYLIADGCIDWDMLSDVYIAGPLSVGRKEYLRILRELDRQLKISIGNQKRRLEEVQAKLREYDNADKSDKNNGGGKNHPAN